MAEPKALKIELWPIENLIPYEKNAKKHDPTQVAKIAKSLQQLGWDQPIVVDRHGVIIKGHGRRLAAMDLGFKKVPVIVRSDLTEEQVKAARLADNRVAQGDYDLDLMREELAELAEQLDGIFDAKELEFMDADLGEMNVGAFATDMGAVLAEQKQDIEQRSQAAAESSIPIAKAMGVKTVPASGAITINRMMAVVQELAKKIEKSEGEAFVAWIEQVLPAPGGSQP